VILFFLLCVCFAGVILGLGWLIAGSLPRWETPAQIGTRAANEYLASPAFRERSTNAIDTAIADELRKPEYRWFRFVKAMQARLHEADPSLDPAVSIKTAMRTYRDFLADNKIEFGDPRFSWKTADAREVIEEYEIRYW
jgi:hypothetical protein